MKRIMHVLLMLAIVAGGCKKEETKPTTTNTTTTPVDEREKFVATYQTSDAQSMSISGSTTTLTAEYVINITKSVDDEGKIFINNFWGEWNVYAKVDKNDITIPQQTVNSKNWGTMSLTGSGFIQNNTLKISYTLTGGQHGDWVGEATNTKK